MGMFDSLQHLFKTPDIARRIDPDNLTRKALLNNVQRTEALNTRLQDAFDPLQAASAGTVGDRIRRRTANTASSAIAQQAPPRSTTFAEAIGDAERRQRARSQIRQQGERQAEGQQLTDRLAVARRGATRRGRVTQGLGSALNIREGVNLGVASADALVNQSRADLAGGLLGGITGVLADPDSRTRLGNFLGGVGNFVGDIFGASRPTISNIDAPTTSTINTSGLA